MKERASSTRTLTSVMLVLFALLFVGSTSGIALADEESAQSQVRSRKETQTTAQDPQGDAFRQRIRERIESEAGLQEQEREQLRRHLEECKQLGLDDATVGAMFSENVQLRAQIKTQERVLKLAREGLPFEPVVQKLQEGLRKGATVEALERVCAKLEEHVRTAHQYMKQVREAGITPGDANAERERVREMAMYMWRGLGEGDMAQLKKRAQERLRNGSCTTEDLSVAAETATRLGEVGIKRERAVELAGSALQNGYTVREMRQLVWAVMTAHAHGESNKAMETLERGIRNQRQFSQMIQEMWQRGWMGPADQQGGHSPVDNSQGSGYGGRHQESGPGGSDQTGGTQGGQGGQGGQEGSGQGGTVK